MRKIILFILFFVFACASPSKKNYNILVSEKESKIKSTNQNTIKKSPIKVLNFSSLPNDIHINKDNYLSCSNYNELDSKYSSRVCKIFKRVVKAADKRANRCPKLLFVNKPGLWAIVQKDGTIRMTIEVTEFCFDHMNNHIGDSRFAFIVGHEIAHIVNDDFWESPLDNIIENNKDIAKYNNHKKEFKADYYGLLYATMAGYDPKAIADSSFIEKWLKYSHGAYKNNTSHPSPENRKQHLFKLCKTIQKNILLFDIGTKLYFIERYDDALDFFETFKQKYPGKEVLNNIGLIYYKKAFNILISFDSKKAYQFNFATAFDTSTHAKSFIKRNSNENQYRNFIDESIRNLEYACKKDAFYFNARLNLSSAYMLSGKCSNFKKAKILLEETISLIDNKELLLDTDDNINLLFNNLAIAIYLCGTTYMDDSNKPCDFFIHTSGYKKIVIDYLIKIFNNDKKLKSIVAYNLGRIFWENDKKDEARTYWLEYIKQKPGDRFAAHIEEVLNIMAIKKKEQKKFDMTNINYPSFVLISINEYRQLVNENISKFNNLIDETNLHDLTKLGINKSLSKYYSGDDFQALFLDNVAVYLEVTPKVEAEIQQNFEEQNNYHHKTRLGYDAYKISQKKTNNILFIKNNIIKEIILYHQ